MKVSTLLGGAVLLGALASAPLARADIITYDVNLNFDPTVAGGGPGAGTITGTVTINTSIQIQNTSIPGQTGFHPTDVTAVNLVENTHGPNTIGGAFGSPTESVFDFTEFAPFTTVFFGSPQVNQSSTALLSEKNGAQYISLFFQTDCCVLDAQPIGPTITFDLPFPDGGDVIPGTFDSRTSEGRFLYGTVTPETDTSTPTTVAEPTSLAIMIMGAGLLVAGRARRRGRSHIGFA